MTSRWHKKSYNDYSTLHIKQSNIYNANFTPLKLYEQAKWLETEFN